MQLCHLAAPNHCPLRLAMEAGSSCLCLLCHRSAQDRQFHSHASVRWMGRMSKNAQHKDNVYSLYSALCLCACMHVMQWQHFSLKLMNTCTQTQTNNAAYTNMQSRHVNMSTHIYTHHSYMNTCAHLCTCIYVHWTLLMMGGSSMLVCVFQKNWHYHLGQISRQQQQAINKTVSLFAFFFFFQFFPFFFFLLRGAKQLMVCLWETSKPCRTYAH